MRVFPHTKHPVRDRNLKGKPLEYSKDVIIYTVEGILGIGFWDFTNKEWAYHTDNMFGADKGFFWCYAPKTLTGKYQRKLRLHHKEILDGKHKRTSN